MKRQNNLFNYFAKSKTKKLDVDDDEDDSDGPDDCSKSLELDQDSSCTDGDDDNAVDDPVGIYGDESDDGDHNIILASGSSGNHSEL